MKGFASSKTFSRWLTSLGLMTMLSVLVLTLWMLLLRLPTRWYETKDMLGYWSASNLLLHGENPYDRAALVALERQQGWLRPEPWYSWNPPWLHVLLLPLGALSFGQAAALWFVVNPLLIGVSALLIWQVVSDARHLRAVTLALIAAFLFSRSLKAVLLGQINTVVLLGCSLFLALALQHKDLLAGAMLVLVTVKPHLCYLLLPSVLLSSWLQRRWGVIIGFFAALMILVSLASWLFPDWVGAYLSVFDIPASPLRGTSYITPTIRGFLLGETGADIGVWPTVVCLAAFVVFIVRRGHLLDLPSIASLSLLAGLPTAPFGWSSDQILLLVPVLQIVAWMPQMTLVARRIVMSSLILIYGYGLLVWLVNEREVAFLVMPLAIGLLWWYARQRVDGASERLGAAAGQPSRH